jgi:hypothetical protein
LGLDVTLRNSGENAAKSGAEIACREEVPEKERGNSLAGFPGGSGSHFFLGVEVTEMRMAGAARSATLAAVGKGKSTQTGTVLGSGHGSLLNNKSLAVSFKL